MGWTRLGNGALLRQAAAEFDAVLTADQNDDGDGKRLEVLLESIVCPPMSSIRQARVPVGLDTSTGR